MYIKQWEWDDTQNFLAVCELQLNARESLGVSKGVSKFALHPPPLENPKMGASDGTKPDLLVISDLIVVLDRWASRPEISNFRFFAIFNSIQGGRSCNPAEQPSV